MTRPQVPLLVVELRWQARSVSTACLPSPPATGATKVQYQAISRIHTKSHSYLTIVCVIVYFVGKSIFAL